jgi:hypothetical protein
MRHSNIRLVFMANKMDMRYPVRERVGPFMKGCLVGSPLVEVALEGLRRGVEGEGMRRYEGRVSARGSVAQICEALRSGRDGPAQEAMAAAVMGRYEESLTHSCHAESAHGIPFLLPRIVDVSAVLRVFAVREVIRCVESGAVTSHAAQDSLAAFVAAIGKPPEIRELLGCGKVTSDQAAGILRMAASR